MSRHARRIDANQPVIVAALREVGCHVLHLHAVGGGCPDLLVLRRGQLHLLEVKDPTVKRWAKKSNELAQQALRDAGWPVHVVTSVDEALAAIGVRS